MEQDQTSNGPVNGAGSGSIILEVRGVTVALGTKTVLENLDMDVRRGEILGFVGASGAGKSVLLRTILGLTKKKAGTIRRNHHHFFHVFTSSRRAFSAACCDGVGLPPVACAAA